MSDVFDMPVRALFAEDLAQPGRVREVSRADSWVAGGADPRELLLGAAFSLMARQMAALLRSLPLERAAEALRSRDPNTAVAGLMSDLALERTAASSGDPTSLAVLRGGRRKRELIEAAGGAASSAEMAEHLGITRQGVEKRRLAGTLLAVRMPGGEWKYPLAQVGADGAPLDGLSTILAAFRVDSPWMRLEHLLAPDPMLSLDAVGAGTAADGARPAARSALQALREDGASAVPAIVSALGQVGDEGG